MSLVLVTCPSTLSEEKKKTMPTELGLLTIRFRDTGSLAVPGRQEAFLVVRLSRCYSLLGIP